MKRMIWITVWALMLTMAAGCQTHRQARELAQKRWALARNKIHFQLAMDQYKANRLELCKAQLNKVLASPEPIIPAYLLAAKVALKEERFGEARDYLDLALHSEPKSAEAWYAKGLLDEFDGDLDAALEALGKAQMLDPADPEYLICLAELHVKRGEADRALAVLTVVQGRFTSHLGIQSALADLYTMQGNHALTIASLRRMLRINPGDGETRERLALAMARDGQAGQAAPLLEQIIEKDKGASVSLQAALADCYVKLKRYDEAESAYASLCANQPGNVHWNYRLAECYTLQNDDQAALARVAYILELDPTHADGRALAGYLHLARGDLEQAAGNSRMAIDRASNPELVAVVLVQALRGLGKDKEADEVWAEFGGNIETARKSGAVGPMATARPGAFNLGGGVEGIQ